MTFSFGIKTYDISTNDLGNDFAIEIEPPLTFTMRSRPPHSWYEAVGRLDHENFDIALAATVLSGLCLKVSNGEAELLISSDQDALIIHEQLKALDPVMADEAFFKLTYRLAGRLMIVKSEDIDALKKTSRPSSGTNKKPTPAKQ